MEPSGWIEKRRAPHAGPASIPRFLTENCEVSSTFLFCQICLGSRGERLASVLLSGRPKSPEKAAVSVATKDNLTGRTGRTARDLVRQNHRDRFALGILDSDLFRRGSTGETSDRGRGWGLMILPCWRATPAARKSTPSIGRRPSPRSISQAAFAPSTPGRLKMACRAEQSRTFPPARSRSSSHMSGGSWALLSHRRS